ncbi:uncharacterized protein LOC132032061 [Lycium ferocissimum]|uniref:uncharacterized protein LOC132032061 n=1 Tax=Lycium ferocissimum TaxID=112874 RepID=UPI0028166F2A|nr:uncharacterized protein LOC132032061 [Lycium ferocissimum]
MTCSVCHVKGHNKRGCPLKRSDGINVQPNTGSSTSTAHDQPKTASNPSGLARGRGRPKKPTTKAEPAAKRGIGRPKRCKRGVGRDVNHPLESWFTCSQTSAGSSSSDAPSSATANRGKGKVVARTTPYKRPRVMGMGVFQAENGVTTFNPGLPSQRIVSTGPRKIIRFADATGDICFKPTSELKWKGTKSITTRRLQEVRDQARATGSNNASQSTTPSLPRDPWNL